MSEQELKRRINALVDETNRLGFTGSAQVHAILESLIDGAHARGELPHDEIELAWCGWENRVVDALNEREVVA